MVLGRTIKKSIKSMIRWAISNDEGKVRYPEDHPSMPVSISGNMSSGHATKPSHNISVNGMNFTIYAATGGKVVEFKAYDPRTDRVVNTLYVITDKEDLGGELGLIITKESLCR